MANLKKKESLNPINDWIIDPIQDKNETLFRELKGVNAGKYFGEKPLGYFFDKKGGNHTLYDKYPEFNAFNHAFESAKLAKTHVIEDAHFLGDLKEATSYGSDLDNWMNGRNLHQFRDILDHNRDRWNNAVGREIGLKYPNLSEKELAKKVIEALDRGDLITDLYDAKRRIAPDYSLLKKDPYTEAEKLLKGSVCVSDELNSGGAAPKYVDPNAPTPSLAEDSANLRLQRERLNDPNDNANLRLQREKLNDPDDNANLRLQSEQYLEMLGKLLSSREGVNSYIRSKQEVTGEIIIPKGQAGKSLYDPTIQNFMDNWPNVKGLIASYEQAIWGKKDDELMPVHPGITSIASQPFGRTKPFQTPNAKTMQRVLYSGVEYGKEYAKGYLYDRGLELAFGKKAAGKIKKAEAYSNTVRTYAPNAWQAASTVLSRTLNSAGYTIGSIAGWVAQGVDLGIKAIGLIPFIGPGLAAAASAVAYAAGYAIGATLGAVSWALTALAAFAW